jgi:hypothetical protein
MPGSVKSLTESADTNLNAVWDDIAIAFYFFWCEKK